MPTVELIVARERDTLLESAVGVRRPTDDVSTKHQPEGHVEVLRDVRLAPDLLLPVCLVDERRILERGPAKEGIVADEGRDLTVRAT